MRKELARTVLVVGSAAVAMVMGISPAMASGTWTVTGGPSFTAVQSGSITINDSTSSGSFACSVAGASGSVTDQTHAANANVGSMTSLTFGSASHKCSGPLGATATISEKSGTTALMTANSFAGGVTSGVADIDIVFTISSILGTCTAEAKGPVSFTYDDSTGRLQFISTGSGLTVTSTSGSCAGIIKSGDVLFISGTIIVTGSPVSVIEISQP
jgi:hypothetical protein